MSQSVDEFAGNDRFQILRRLGAGGFGVVYEASDRQRGTVVALKVLRQADPANLYRFKRELASKPRRSSARLAKR